VVVGGGGGLVVDVVGLVVVVDDGGAVVVVVDEVGLVVVVVELVVLVELVVGAELDDVDVGPGLASFTAGAKPSRAASIFGSLPSIPRAQIPRPARLYCCASWASR